MIASLVSAVFMVIVLAYALAFTLALLNTAMPRTSSVVPKVKPAPVVHVVKSERFYTLAELDRGAQHGR